MRITVPSARNLEIFHRVVEDGAPLRRVSDEFHLSHNRVAEIVQQVKRWRKYAAPDWDEGRSRRQDSVVLCRFHQDRLGHMYSIMMDAWRNSGERMTQRNGSITTVTSPGDIKYIAAAMRISREQVNAGLVIAKLPDEYFEPVEEIEVVAMTPEEILQENHEENLREEMDEARQEYAERKVRETQRVAELMRQAREEEEELDDDDDEEETEDEPPVSVLTTSAAETASAAATAGTTPRATRVDEPTLDVADIVRQQSRHDRRKRITPVQATADNEEKRRELAAKLFG